MSMNYLEDLRSLRAQLASGRNLFNSHLAHQFLLPDYNTKDVSKPQS